MHSTSFFQENYLSLQKVVRFLAEKPHEEGYGQRPRVVERAVAVQRQLTDRAILYTRHCDDGSRRPYAIPDREMNVFMLVASLGETGLEYFGDEDRKFAEGQRVRVTDGPFRGAEGSIQRIHGDRRLLVSIRGICAVATTYIPKAFLEEIN